MKIDTNELEKDFPPDEFESTHDEADGFNRAIDQAIKKIKMV